MEPINLNNEIINLFTVFTSCLEVVNKLQPHSTFEGNLHVPDARLKAATLRLEQWGLDVGIKPIQPTHAYHPALNDKAISNKIAGLLKSISEVFGNASHALTRRKKAEKVETFEKLVQQLYDLVSRTAYDLCVERPSGCNRQVANKGSFRRVEANGRSHHEISRKPSHIASQDRDMGMVNLLSDTSAEIPPLENRGLIPLELDSGNGSEKVIQVPLEKGVDIEAGNSDCWAPPNLTSDNVHMGTIKELLYDRADVPIQTSDGWGTLRLVPRHGYSEISKMIVEKGADVEMANDKGWTAMHAMAIWK